MTSNVGSQLISAVSSGQEDQAAYEAMKRQVTEALRAQFRPEFLNRVDEIIVFHALTTSISPRSSNCSSPASSGASPNRT